MTSNQRTPPETRGQEGRPHIGLVPDFRLPLPATDGIGVYSRSLIESLADAPPDFRFTVFMDEKHLPSLPELPDHFRIAAVRPLPSSRTLDAAWHLLVLPLLARHRQVDLLHVFAGNRRATLYPSRRSLLTVHDIHHCKHREGYDIARFLFFRHIVMPRMRSSPHLIAVSQATRKDLERVLPETSPRIHVVRNGFDPDRFRVLADPDAITAVRRRHGLARNYILYVSVLDHPRKNHLGLLAGFRLLVEELHEPPELVLVGEEFWKAETVRAEIHRQGLDGRIHLISAIPPEDLVALYNGARLLAHPSRWEGFGLPVLEAMGCGLPVACSDIPAFRELAGDAAVYFHPRDPASIAGALSRLLEDEALRTECRTLGLQRARELSWRNTAEGVLNVYREVLGNGAAPLAGRLSTGSAPQPADPRR